MWWNRFAKLEKKKNSAYSGGGAMIAFYIPSAIGKKIKLSEENAPEDSKIEKLVDLHMTLAYFGDRDSLEPSKDNMIKSLEKLAKETKPIDGLIAGIGLFNNIQEDDTKPFYASFDGSTLPAFRQKLVTTMNKIKGVKVDDKHGFTPHISLAYIPKDAPIPSHDIPLTDIRFDEITLSWGDDHYVFKLTG